jgi:hypothetical protein
VYGGHVEAHEHCCQLEAPVEPVAGFGKVARQMMRPALVVRAERGVLDVADDRVEPAEVWSCPGLVDRRPFGNWRSHNAEIKTARHTRRSSGVSQMIELVQAGRLLEG